MQRMKSILQFPDDDFLEDAKLCNAAQTRLSGKQPGGKIGGLPLDCVEIPDQLGQWQGVGIEATRLAVRGTFEE